MEKEKTKRLITNWRFDFNTHWMGWDKGKIDDRQMLNHMLDSCFFLFRKVATDFLENMK